MGKMSEIATLEDEPIVGISMSSSGEQCAVARELEVDICAPPGMEVTSSMILRRTQRITHIEFDNDGNHMLVQMITILFVLFSCAHFDFCLAVS